MPRLLVINPNSTAAMTASIAAAARAAAGPDTTISAVNPDDTPPAIQGAEDGRAALPGLFATFDAETAAAAYDAVIIACFDDTGLAELKARGAMPVVGIGEAAYHVAMLLGANFSVVTTLPVSIPVLEDNLHRYGFDARCSTVRAANVPVLDFETSPASAAAALATEIAATLETDAPDAIVLGCAGMADLAASLGQRFGLPVIDGVAAAVKLAEALAGLAPQTARTQPA